MSRKPTENIDYTSRDYEAYREDMIRFLQTKIPEYTDISQTDAGIVIIEALANGLDILSLYTDVVMNDVVLPTTQDRKLAVMLAECLGYIPYNQTASEYPQVFVLDEISEDITIIPKGTVVRTAESSDLTTLYFETMNDLTIPAGRLGNETDETGNYLFTTKVKHGTSVSQDIIGSSSEAPLQSFKLTYTDVLVDSINLYVNEGYGQFLWKRVDNFIDCDANSMVYKVTVDEFDVCTIEFGNGLRGKVPKAYQNGIVANYRIGGGEVGNVSANIITELDTNIPYVESTFNLSATVKGHDKESLESIRENAPAYFRTRDRLVTLKDYEDLLRINFYEFLRLKAVRDEEDKKKARIFYIMRPGYEEEMYYWELPEKVAEFIYGRSMIGTTYELRPYVREGVSLDCVLYVDQDYNSVDVVNDIKDYLLTVVFNTTNMQFDDYIVKSDLEREIKEAVSGVISFRIKYPEEDIIKPTSPENVLTLIIDDEKPENNVGSLNIEVRTL